jgi:hypothetical protein
MGIRVRIVDSGIDSPAAAGNMAQHPELRGVSEAEFRGPPRDRLKRDFDSAAPPIISSRAEVEPEIDPDRVSNDGPHS